MSSTMSHVFTAKTRTAGEVMAPRREALKVAGRRIRTALVLVTLAGAARAQFDAYTWDFKHGSYGGGQTWVSGDQLDIQIYELYEVERFHPIARRVDQGGHITIPEVGSLAAAGLTVDEFHHELVRGLRERVMGSPTVTVNLVEGAAFNYIIYGN